MPSLQHVVLLDKIDPSAAAIFTKNGVTASVYEKFTEIPAETLANLDGLIVRSATKVTAEVMAQCPKLAIIGRAGTGVDNIDVPAATSRGIVVMNTPGGNTISAAEHTCYMIVSLARNATNNNHLMKEHKWIKGAGQELLGKTLGIIGLGRIGSEVAHRMQAFGMRTIGFDPIVSPDVAAKSGIEWMPLEKLWPLVDFVTVHTPLIPQTRDLVSTKTLGLCKKGVKVINVARGGIINETDLLTALESGQCGGAGLDVFVDEPVKDWKLVDHPNVVATSHLGASTKEAQLKCGQEIAQQFVDFSNNASGLVGVINSPALVSSLSNECAPWLKLGSALGQLIASAAEGKVAGAWSAEIIGEERPKNLKSFAVASVATGVMKSQGNGVNVVNAPALADKAGVTVTVTENKVSGDSRSLLRVTGPSGMTVAGFVDGTVPYLFSIDSSVFSEPFALIGSNLFSGKQAANLSKVVTDVSSFGIQRVQLSGDWVVGSTVTPVTGVAGINALTL